MLLCRVIGNVHTVASVYWCVVVESMSWVCMLMGGGGGVHTVVYPGIHNVGGEKCYLVCGE